MNVNKLSHTVAQGGRRTTTTTTTTTTTSVAILAQGHALLWSAAFLVCVSQDGGKHRVPCILASGRAQSSLECWRLRLWA